LFFFATLIAIATACRIFAFSLLIFSFFAIVEIAFARVFHGFSFTSLEMFLEIVFWLELFFIGIELNIKK